MEVLAMSGRVYKGFVVAVEGVEYAVGTPSRCPLIKISADGRTVALLFFTDEFTRAKDAEVYGLQMAEIWIDGHLPGEVNFG
jgi:hypothetical protein